MLVGLIALLVIGLIVVPGIQRDAWMQGYLAGQLTGQDAGKAAPLAPYLYPGYGGPAFGPHFGGLGALFGLALLFFFIFGFGRLFLYRTWRCMESYGGQGDRPHRSGPPDDSAYGGRQRRHRPWWDWDEPSPGQPEQPAEGGREQPYAERGGEA